MVKQKPTEKDDVKGEAKEEKEANAAQTQKSKALDAAFSMLGQSRILTLVHEGLRGRCAINRQAEKFLRKKLDIAVGHAGGHGLFYGQPVIMTVNHHALDLYNGDTGIVVSRIETIARFGGKNEFIGRNQPA